MVEKSAGSRVLAAQTNDSLRSQGRRQNSAYNSSKIIFFFPLNGAPTVTVIPSGTSDLQMSAMSDLRKNLHKSVLVIIALALTAVIGCKKEDSRSESKRTYTAADAKEAIAKQLKRQTGRDEFKAPLEITKEKNPWLTLQAAYDAPPDYKTVYRSMGEHIFIAENMMSSSDARTAANGLRIIAELTDVARDVAYDPWFGARLADAYLVPAIDRVGESVRYGLNSEQLYHISGRAYKEADEDEALINLGKSYLAKYGDSPRAADIRQRLVYTLQRKGRKEEAQKIIADGKAADEKRRSAKSSSTTATNSTASKK